MELKQRHMNPEHVFTERIDLDRRSAVFSETEPEFCLSHHDHEEHAAAGFGAN